MAFVELAGLTKRYGALAVVNAVDLTIEKGKLVCLLGPSGCGKTTTLPLIAGFIAPDEGEIRQLLIRQSIASYPGNCPCPDNFDRAGRR